MQLDHNQLRELIALLGESDIQELKLEGDDFRLELRRNLPARGSFAPGRAPSAGGDMRRGIGRSAWQYRAGSADCDCRARRD